MNFIILFALIVTIIPPTHHRNTCDSSHLTTCITLGEKHYKKGEVIEAIKLYQLPCKQGIGFACAMIGVSYSEGKGDLAKDTQKGKYYYAKGCDAQYTNACRNLGILYQKEKNASKAVEAYQKGCDSKGIGSCYNLGTMYLQGDGLEKNLSKAKNYYKKACTYGSKDGCIRFEKLTETNTTASKSSADPFESLIEKCIATKDAIACHNISALYYQSGKYEKALQFDEKACRYKYAMGCKDIALTYYKGDHTPKDKNKALSFFKVAGSLGDGGSLYNVGLMYERGDGVTKDLKEAKDFFIRACTKKDMPSCNKLGHYFEEGTGVKKDMHKAKSYYEKACDNQYGKGCANVAFFYLRGIGIDKDPFNAKIYFSKACALGDKQSCKNYKLITLKRTK